MSKASDEMEEIIKRYIFQLLDSKETILKCINLGMNPSEDTKVELSLIEESRKYLKKKIK